MYVALVKTAGGYQVAEIDPTMMNLDHLPAGTIRVQYDSLPTIDDNGEERAITLDDVFTPDDDDIRAQYVVRIQQFAESMREQVVGGASRNEVAGWMVNLAILDLIDGGTAISDLPPRHLAKIDAELASDPRFNTRQELIDVWQNKAALYALATGKVQGLQAAALEAVQSTPVADLEALVEHLRTSATAEFSALMGV